MRVFPNSIFLRLWLCPNREFAISLSFGQVRAASPKDFSGMNASSFRRSLPSLVAVEYGHHTRGLTFQVLLNFIRVGSLEEPACRKRQAHLVPGQEVRCVRVRWHHSLETLAA